MTMVGILVLFDEGNGLKMLAEVQARVPQLYPYAAACYSNPNVLFGNGYEVISTQGVQLWHVVSVANTLHCKVLKLEELGMRFQFW